jgi:hypothetical protein
MEYFEEVSLVDLLFLFYGNRTHAGEKRGKRKRREGQTAAGGEARGRDVSGRWRGKRMRRHILRWRGKKERPHILFGSDTYYSGHTPQGVRNNMCKYS